MKIVTGVRFKKPGKIYYFDPENIQLDKGMNVIVDTAMGEEYGEVVIARKEVEDNEVTEPLKKVIRIATHKDEKMRQENKAKEKDAYKTCLEKISKHELPMKLIDAEYKYDGSKLIFYFTADGRIDFRELVKDLAAVFRTRIELRQIGVRDEVKRCGGNGVCGRELCCCTFLGNFETVSIKMAKEQNISLNPSKISGNCGRLMCCLKYEQEVYEEKLKILPKVGAIVKTQEGTGEVCAVETLKEVVRVKYQDGEDVYFKKHEAKDVVVIKDVERDDDRLVADNDADLEELKNLEKLERADKNNTSHDDI
ncbi:MAG: stage 0 sporulation family protein [Clostridia bacterium]|nr:stage 0 sporulation family protein [Clostridia bacterium]